MSTLSDKIEKENIKEIERQLERLGFFTQNGLTSLTNRVNELESALYGLINTLLLGETIDAAKLKEVSALVSKNMVEKGEQQRLSILMNAPENELNTDKSVPMVNCDERIHICKAVCCKLRFALEPEEIEKGIVKWDLGIPYQIRQKKNGYCSHIDNEKRCCTIYNDRPKVCSKFNCTNDKRLWKDFEKMELNHEWIAENIKDKKVTFAKDLPNQ